jgi:hypothetical protein
MQGWGELSAGMSNLGLLNHFMGAADILSGFERWMAIGLPG